MSEALTDVSPIEEARALATTADRSIAAMHLSRWLSVSARHATFLLQFLEDHPGLRTLQEVRDQIGTLDADQRALVRNAEDAYRAVHGLIDAGLSPAEARRGVDGVLMEMAIDHRVSVSRHASLVAVVAELAGLPAVLVLREGPATAIGRWGSVPGMGRMSGARALAVALDIAFDDGWRIAAALTDKRSRTTLVSVAHCVLVGAVTDGAHLLEQSGVSSSAATRFAETLARAFPVRAG